MKVVLNYENGKVTCDGIELTINPQATKRDGQGDPVVSLKKIPGWTEGMQEWKSIRLWDEGEHTIEIGDKVEKGSTSLLTQEEKDKIAELEAQIKAIKDAAKGRQPQKPKKLEEYSLEELKARIEQLTKELDE